MSLSNPIEAMARAIWLIEFENDFGEPLPSPEMFDRQVVGVKQHFRRQAKAALQSLLDHPLPEEVREAGADAITNLMKPDGERDWISNREAEEGFHAMIRKLLEDQDSSGGRDERTATPPTSTPGQAGKEG